MRTNYVRKWLLAAGLLIAALNVQASQESGACGENVFWTFDFDSGILHVYGEGEMGSLPPFYYWDKIKTIIVDEGIISLADYAFQGLGFVETVKLPSTLKSISDGAFRWCASLASVKIPDGVKSIGNNAFVECPMTSIDLPAGLESIGDQAFMYTKLMSLVLPPVHLGQSAFSCCYDLKTVVMTEGRTVIEDGAFSGCNNLSSVILPSTLKEIEGSAFSSTALQEVIVPEGVTKIGQWAFSHSALSWVQLPSTLETIEDYAFHHCEQLRTIRCYAVTPPEAQGYYPFGVAPGYITLEVLASVVDDYKTANYYNSFGVIKPIYAEANISSIGYTTFYWPFEDLEIPTGLQAFIGNVSGQWLILTEIENKIPAGTPVILKGKEGTYVFNSTTGAEAVGQNDLRGTDNRLDADGIQYVLAEKDGVVGFYKATGTIPTGKAYIEYAGAAVKGFFFGGADGIANVKDADESHAVIYDLSGRRVEKATKGMYIINGKKVMK